MRRKIAKRRRRELLRVIDRIESSHFIREPGWRRKDCGYAVTFKSKDGTVWTCMEDDMLTAYQLALWCLDLGKEPGYTGLRRPHGHSMKYFREKAEEQAGKEGKTE